MAICVTPAHRCGKGGGGGRLSPAVDGAIQKPSNSSEVEALIWMMKNMHISWQVLGKVGLLQSNTLLYNYEVFAIMPVLQVSSNPLSPLSSAKEPRIQV